MINKFVMWVTGSQQGQFPGDDGTAGSPIAVATFSFNLVNHTFQAGKAPGFSDVALSLACFGQEILDVRIDNLIEDEGLWSTRQTWRLQGAMITQLQLQASGQLGITFLYEILSESLASQDPGDYVNFQRSARLWENLRLPGSSL